jgi:hypothetical protein
MAPSQYVIANPRGVNADPPSWVSAMSDNIQRTRSKTSASGIRNVAGSLLFLLLSFVAIRHAQPTGIILYQGVVLGLSISLAQFVTERRRALSVSEAAKNALLTLLLVYCFVSNIPTTVDRAYSVKVLTAVGRSPDGLTRGEISDLLVDGLVAGGLDRRAIGRADIDRADSGSEWPVLPDAKRASSEYVVSHSPSYFRMRGHP